MKNAILLGLGAITGILAMPVISHSQDTNDHLHQCSNAAAIDQKIAEARDNGVPMEVLEQRMGDALKSDKTTLAMIENDIVVIYNSPSVNPEETRAIRFEKCMSN